MGIRDWLAAPASPWQNGFAERLIESIRRQCLDHIVVLGEAHLRGILRSYERYYNNIKTLRSLDKAAPAVRSVQLAGSIKRAPSSADSTTTTSEFRFSVHTAVEAPFDQKNRTHVHRYLAARAVCTWGRSYLFGVAPLAGGKPPTRPASPL
jgi:hypothetical protein